MTSKDKPFTADLTMPSPRFSARSQWDGGAWGMAALALLVVAAVPMAVAATAQRDGDAGGDHLPGSLFFKRQEKTRYKAYSGIRRDPSAPRQVYFYEQTVAVVELGAERELLNCELIEVKTPEIANETLKSLSKINTPIPISFKDMQTLMYQCKDFEAPDASSKKSFKGPSLARVNLMTALTGILPGTKWCGNGDLASNYFDLGYLADVDKCCRAHDICPVKIRGYESRYGLDNRSFYTKSHCDCDTTLYECLKSQKQPTANLMGIIYFNVLRVQCIEDVKSKNTTNETPNQTTKRQFRNPLNF